MYYALEIYQKKLQTGLVHMNRSSDRAGGDACRSRRQAAALVVASAGIEAVCACLVRLTGRSRSRARGLSVDSQVSSNLSLFRRPREQCRHREGGAHCRRLFSVPRDRQIQARRDIDPLERGGLAKILHGEQFAERGQLGVICASERGVDS